MDSALKEVRESVAKKLFHVISDDVIVEVTGLSLERILELREEAEVALKTKRNGDKTLDKDVLHEKSEKGLVRPAIVKGENGSGEIKYDMKGISKIICNSGFLNGFVMSYKESIIKSFKESSGKDFEGEIPNMPSDTEIEEKAIQSLECYYKSQMEAACNSAAHKRKE